MTTNSREVRTGVVDGVWLRKDTIGHDETHEERKA